MGQFIDLAKQLWVQELVWGGLLILLLISYVLRFNHIGRTQQLRTQRRHHRRAIGHTRILGILIVIGAGLTFAGHQFWPEVSALADRVAGVAAVKSSSKAKAKSTSTSTRTTSSKASSSSSSTASSTQTVTAESAVEIVKGYFAKHPGDQADSISSYKAVGTGSDAVGAFVYKVGAFGADGTSELHEYWVHRDGKFDVAY